MTAAVAKKDETKFRVVDASFVAAGSGIASLPPPDFAEVAFAGRSNVGKSSLLNMLLQRNKLVRTSSSPGCTKTLNVFHAKVQVGSEKTILEMNFTDLPGYGYAKISRAESKAFKGMVEGYLARRSTLVALVLIVDVRRGPEEEERELTRFMDAVGDGARARKAQVFMVATKIDKLPLSAQKTAIADVAKAAKLPVTAVTGVSAVTAVGRDALWQKIQKVITLV